MHQWELTAAQLRAAMAVAEHRSFIAAAAALGQSQPALTRTIQRIENIIGVELFSRTTRQVSVTPAGREFAVMAQRLLNDLKIGVESLRKLNGDERGQIILSSVLPLTDTTLASVVAGYARKFPGMEIHIRQGLQNQIVDDVRSGAADFAIGYVDDLPQQFASERIRLERFYAVFPRNYPLSRDKVIHIRSLKGANLVSFPPESRTRRVVDGAAATLGFSLRYAVTVNQGSTLLELVRQGAGITILPASDCPSARDRDFAIRLLVGRRLSCQLGILHLRERMFSASVADFLDLMRSWLRKGGELPYRRPRI